MMDYLILSDIPTPWREPVFERVYNMLGGRGQVVYFRTNESRRLWTFKYGSHPKTILRGVTLIRHGKERTLNPGILPLLLRQRPRSALIFSSFKDPTEWLALVLCRLLGTRVALLSDSWLGREHGISKLQKAARHFIYNNLGDAFVGASRKTLAMYQHYNDRITSNQLFLSHLVADNAYFQARLAGRRIERDFDVMFSGQIYRIKNPEFFAKVCASLKDHMGKCRALIIGDGQEDAKAAMRSILDEHGVDYEFAGFLPHAVLPDYYARTKLLLLPTSADCWGVVINEAMAAGTPVITTEMTAAAGELVLPKQNGFILPLDIDIWVQTIADVLSDPIRWSELSEHARTKVLEFNFDEAATGILKAFRYLEHLGERSESSTSGHSGAPLTKSGPSGGQV